MAIDAKKIRRQLAAGAFGILVTSMFCSCAAAPGESSVERSTNVAKFEKILREAGASSADILWFEQNRLRLHDATPQEIADYVEYLGQQSADGLVKAVKAIHSDSQYELGPDSQQHEGVPEGHV